MNSNILLKIMTGFPAKTQYDSILSMEEKNLKTCDFLCVELGIWVKYIPHNLDNLTLNPQDPHKIQCCVSVISVVLFNEGSWKHKNDHEHVGYNHLYTRVRRCILKQGGMCSKRSVLLSNFYLLDVTHVHQDSEKSLSLCIHRKLQEL